MTYLVIDKITGDSYTLQKWPTLYLLDRGPKYSVYSVFLSLFLAKKHFYIVGKL